MDTVSPQGRLYVLFLLTLISTSLVLKLLGVNMSVIFCPFQIPMRWYLVGGRGGVMGLSCSGGNAVGSHIGNNIASRDNVFDCGTAFPFLL